MAHVGDEFGFGLGGKLGINFRRIEGKRLLLLAHG